MSAGEPGWYQDPGGSPVCDGGTARPGAPSCGRPAPRRGRPSARPQPRAIAADPLDRGPRHLRPTPVRHLSRGPLPTPRPAPPSPLRSSRTVVVGVAGAVIVLVGGVVLISGTTPRRRPTPRGRRHRPPTTVVPGRDGRARATRSTPTPARCTTWPRDRTGGRVRRRISNSATWTVALDPTTSAKVQVLPSSLDSPQPAASLTQSDAQELDPAGTRADPARSTWSTAPGPTSWRTARRPGSSTCTRTPSMPPTSGPSWCGAALVTTKGDTGRHGDAAVSGGGGRRPACRRCCPTPAPSASSVMSPVPGWYADPSRCGPACAGGTGRPGPTTRGPRPPHRTAPAGASGPPRPDGAPTPDATRATAPGPGAAAGQLTHAGCGDGTRPGAGYGSRTGYGNARLRHAQRRLRRAGPTATGLRHRSATAGCRRPGDASGGRAGPGLAVVGLDRGRHRRGPGRHHRLVGLAAGPRLQAVGQPGPGHPPHAPAEPAGSTPPVDGSRRPPPWSPPPPDSTLFTDPGGVYSISVNTAWEPPPAPIGGIQLWYLTGVNYGGFRSSINMVTQTLPAALP